MNMLQTMTGIAPPVWASPQWWVGLEQTYGSHVIEYYLTWQHIKVRSYVNSCLLKSR